MFYYYLTKGILLFFSRKFTWIDGICGSTIDREWKNVTVNEIELETFLNLSVEEF